MFYFVYEKQDFEDDALMDLDSGANEETELLV